MVFVGIDGSADACYLLGGVGGLTVEQSAQVDMVATPLRPEAVERGARPRLNDGHGDVGVQAHVSLLHYPFYKGAKEITFAELYD